MKLLMTIVLFMFSVGTNAAKLKVLYDTGDSSLVKYHRDPKIKLERPDPIEFLANNFPVVSKKWRVGEFKSKRISFPEMKTPIFIIGCDDDSLNWVEYRKELIQKKRVLGFVVNCKTFEDYNELKAAVYPIVVQPISLDVLSEHLQHGLYPAYIHQTAIEQ